MEYHCETFLSKELKVIWTSCWIRMVESNFEVRTCRMRGTIVAHPRFPAGPLAPVPIDIQQYWRHMFARSPSAAVRTRTLRPGADDVGSAFSHFLGSLCCWHSIRKSNKRVHQNSGWKGFDTLLLVPYMNLDRSLFSLLYVLPIIHRRYMLPKFIFVLMRVISQNPSKKDFKTFSFQSDRKKMFSSVNEFFFFLN